jgi:hypothetical protein
MSKPLHKLVACGAIICAAMWCCLAWVAPPRTTHAAGADGITGVPADITPLLSLAGVWQPIADQYIDQKTPSTGTGSIANTYAGNIVLPNGKEGLVVTGWSFAGFSRTATSVTPVNVAVLEQQPDGTLRLATPKYIPDPETNGGANVLVADFNHDGVQDLFLPAHNESPFLPASSTAYLSNASGTYSKVTVGDRVEAHGAALAYVGGEPTVFTGSYYVAPQPDHYADTAVRYGASGFTIVPDIGTGGNSSVAVGDFYGDGTYSYVCGDCLYGPGFPFDLNSPDHLGLELWNLTGLTVAGNPFRIGTPYFNRKAQYAGYPSFSDPFKTHSDRAWVDDFRECPEFR